MSYSDINASLDEPQQSPALQSYIVGYRELFHQLPGPTVINWHQLIGPGSMVIDLTILDLFLQRFRQTFSLSILSAILM